MSRFSKILFALALAALISVAAMVSRQKLRTPREVLDEVQVELQQDAYDEMRLLRQLASAIRRAEKMDTQLPAVRELCAQLRLTRGRLYMEIGANTDAREDLEKVLAEYRVGDSEVRRMLVEVDSSDGDLEGALERLEELLVDEPGYGPAWVESGRLHQRLAQLALEQADERLRYVLISGDAELARERLACLAARVPADPLRTSDILVLRKLFPASEEETLAQILELCQVAGADLQQARESYLRSFQYDLYPLAVRGYLEILVAASRDGDALRFGTLVAQRDAAATDAETGKLLIATLGKRGDWRHASELATQWARSAQPLDAEFLRLICHSIYMGRRWNSLFAAANRLGAIGSTDDEALSAFYRGLGYANAKVPRIDLALRALQVFALSRAPEPFEGARSAAWARIAELWREQGETSREREAIQAVLIRDPDYSGELWLRRMEIQRASAFSGNQLPLDSLTHAMRLMPRRTEELMPTFIELGEEGLAAQDLDITIIFRELAGRRQTVPRRDYGPYVLLELARQHGRNHNPAAQAAIAKRLLRDYPGFLPALDELIAARDAQVDRHEFVELVVQRAELVGLDEHTLDLLASITEEEYEPGQVVRMMMADTKGMGRVAVAKWLYRHGQVVGALETLRAAGSVERSPHELLLGARIEIERGNYKQALVWLDALPEGGARVRERRLSSLLCALQIQDRGRIRKLAGEIFAREAPSSAEGLKLADVFLRLGEKQGALRILEQLESASGVDPGPVLLRHALTLLATGDLLAAEEQIDRAEPFLSETQSVVLRLLLEGRQRDWVASQRSAEQLLELAPPESPELAGLLFLLVGREDEALELAEFALELTPQSLVWALCGSVARLREELQVELPPDFGRYGTPQTLRFLRGDEEHPLDPREVVPLLLAAELPEFRPYLQARLRAIDVDVRGRLWPRLLEAALLDEMGFEEEAQPVLESVAATFADCLPVWERLELAYAERLGSLDHPRVLEIRERRIRVMARAYPDGPEATLLEGGIALRQGDLARALRLTSSALEVRPGWIAAHLQLARIETAMGNWEEARAAWRRIARHEDPDIGSRAIEGFIEMLELAAAEGPEALSSETHIAALLRLEEDFPDDPRPPLALARLDLAMDPSNPSVGVGRALIRLRVFREEHADHSLEELQRGATRAWSQFYVQVDPGAAQEFLEHELEREPGDIELWRLLGRVYRELGDLERSTKFLLKAGRMTPDPAIQLELARTLVASGADPRALSAPLREARRVTGGEDSFEARLLLVEALLGQFAPSAWKTAIERLQPLWDSRADLEDPADRARLAQLYARGLLLRGEPGDAQLAQRVLLSSLRFAEPLYQLEAMQVLVGVSRSLEPTQP